jgi:tetratricopeptide (TPR) repeat protein/predicted Ser/Thr protein kinase
VPARAPATRSPSDEPAIEPTLPNTGGAAPVAEPGIARGTAIRRYVVLDRIGAGGMGVVYAAYDYGLDRRIALKLVRDRGGADARARLIREAQVLARLSHPNVVAVYDVGEHDGEVYVAMELVEGSSLRAWLAAAPRGWRAIVEVFRAAGAGLAAAHAAGIVHRDVKPDNILLDGGGAVRIGDFGLARRAADAGDHAPGAGTPAYMAPEQHAGRELDPRADQFAFCVALYEALYGVRPFAGDDRAALCAAITAGELPPATRDVPGWLRAAIARGLSADPDARYPSMTALLARLAPPRPRWPWLAAGAALIAAIVGWRALAGAPACQPAPLGAWDVPQQVTTRAAFVAAGAGEAFDRVADALAARTTAWQRMRLDACEATRVRAEQTPAVLDLRMACLDDRAADLRALAARLATADRATAAHALDAVRGLEPIEACSRSAIRAGGRRATDPLAAPRRRQLAELQAQYLVGDRAGALIAARRLADTARAAADRELEGQALRVAGQALTARGDVAGAEAALYAAVAAAEAADAGGLAARVWLDLVWLVGDEGERYAEAHRLAAIAAGTLDRIGGDRALQAVYEDRLGVIFYDEARYAEAAPHLARGLALRDQLFGPASVEAAASLQHLAMLYTAEGRDADALDLHHRARENAERGLGPSHPDTLAILGGEAAALYKLGRLGEALALFERALAEVRRRDPDDLRGAADLVINIAEIQRRLGRLSEARTSLTGALAMLERVGGERTQGVAAALTNLGLVLADLGAYDDAVARITRAAAIEARVLGGDHPDVAETLSALGAVLVAAHRPGEAVAPLERALAIRARHPGADRAAAEDRVLLARARAAR